MGYDMTLWERPTIVDYLLLLVSSIQLILIIITYRDRDHDHKSSHICCDAREQCTKKQ